MKNIAIIGTVGVPANYGGFETLVENIIGGEGLNEFKYTVFCSSRSYKNKMDNYKRANLCYINIKANGIQSTIYDIISMLRCSNRFDSVLILGVSGCLFLPIFRLYYKNKIIVNIDGLESRRQKWGNLAKCFLRISEAIAVKYSDTIVSDNIGIQQYVKKTYGKKSALICYGGDHAIREINKVMENDILSRYGLKKKEYAISVCRIEPENNCHIILEAFSKTKMKIVFVGNWMQSKYGRMLKKQYSTCSNTLMCDAEYDLDILYILRKNSWAYIHGHSAGGTNPSLVEAMSIGCHIIAYDIVYNRETTHNLALYFSCAQTLIGILNRKQIHQNGELMKKVAYEHYKWGKIVREYEELF